MVLNNVQQTYVFPRIPIIMEIPDNYPDLGKIANISVLPRLRHYRFSKDELEIEGAYQVTVSYFKDSPGRENVAGSKAPGEKDFFGQLRIQDDGLLCDAGEENMPRDYDSRELYTVQFSRPIHTFVDLEFISRPRSFRPGLVVENVHFEGEKGRTLKGELVLGLVNKSRRGYW